MKAKRIRSSYEIQKLADFWFDLSKIILGSLVLKLFEPGIAISINSFLMALTGLILSFACVRVGMKFATIVPLKN